MVHWFWTFLTPWYLLIPKISDILKTNEIVRRVTTENILNIEGKSTILGPNVMSKDIVINVIQRATFCADVSMDIARLCASGRRVQKAKTYPTNKPETGSTAAPTQTRHPEVNIFLLMRHIRTMAATMTRNPKILPIWKNTKYCINLSSNRVLVS